MPAIATVLSIFVIPSLHAVLRPCSRTGVAKRRCGAPRSAAVSANAATLGPYGLRTVGAGGGCFLLPRQRPFRRIRHNMQETLLRPLESKPIKSVPPCLLPVGFCC